MDGTKRDASGQSFRDRHYRNPQRDGFPGIDTDGMTLQEIRRRLRGESMELDAEVDDVECGEGETK